MKSWWYSWGIFFVVQISRHRSILRKHWRYKVWILHLTISLILSVGHFAKTMLWIWLFIKLVPVLESWFHVGQIRRFFQLANDVYILLTNMNLEWFSHPFVAVHWYINDNLLGIFWQYLINVEVWWTWLWSSSFTK